MPLLLLLLPPPMPILVPSLTTSGVRLAGLGRCGFLHVLGKALQRLGQLFLQA
jgi:hypothetical protein